jgi:hypothetical protein
MTIVDLRLLIVYRSWDSLVAVVSRISGISRISSVGYLFPICPVDHLFLFTIRVITRVNRITTNIDRIRAATHMTKKMHSTFTPFIRKSDPPYQYMGL